MKRLLLLLIPILTLLLSCRTQKYTDQLMEEDYNSLIRTAYYQDEDSLAYYRALVSTLQSERVKIDTIFINIHDSVYVENNGLNTTTYKYRDRIIYRTTKETLTQISNLQDSLMVYQSHCQHLEDSISYLNNKVSNRQTVTEYTTPLYIKILAILGIFFIITVIAMICSFLFIEYRVRHV